jgi:hypothetical protein
MIEKHYECLTCHCIVIAVQKPKRCTCTNPNWEYRPVYINQQEFEILKNSLNGNHEFEIEINEKLDYFNKNPFKTKSINYFSHKFKVMITFYNSDGIGEDEENIPEEFLNILRNPDLFNEITEREFDKKIVGELDSRKTIFLCANGRLIENCQIASYNLLVNDEAGTGKDYVSGAVLEIFPKEYYIHKTRISPTVFTYWKPVESWDGIVFYPEDISETVLNSDVFKVMSSKGSSAVITIKNKAVDIEIKGKPVIITTTASATPNQELIRRFAILNLDSSEDQTKAIMRKYSEYKKLGITPEYDQKYTEAMKYLRRVKVKIPFADLIAKHFPSKSVIMRTHYPRFLDFISASTGFHQFQRKKEGEFILAEGQDYDIARRCFLKLCSNKYMIPLTINQKRILEIFEKEPNLRGSVSQFHVDKMSFISLPALQTNLGILVRYGILQTNIEKDSWNRDIEIYSLSKSYNPKDKLEIPTFEELTKISLEPCITLEALTPLIPQKELGIEAIKDIKSKNDINFPELDKDFENG